jgi:hypothetical protein
MLGGFVMEDLSYDFDVLAERADDCGALWAVRMLYRMVSTGEVLPRNWRGTMEEARHLVESFAIRAGFAERESLAAILQYSAELTWADSLDRMQASAPEPPRTIDRRDPIPSISWHLEKLSFS